jgi:hypothetical protein
MGSRRLVEPESRIVRRPNCRRPFTVNRLPAAEIGRDRLRKDPAGISRWHFRLLYRKLLMRAAAPEDRAHALGGSKTAEGLATACMV